MDKQTALACAIALLDGEAGGYTSKDKLEARQELFCLFNTSVTWPDVVEKIRQEHNGVFGVELFFGHDGHNACRFRDYNRVIAQGESGVSMEEAVQRCLSDFKK